MSETFKACQGAPTSAQRSGCEHGRICLHCEMWVRDDLVDHPFFGFKGCDDAPPETAGKEAQG